MSWLLCNIGLARGARLFISNVSNTPGAGDKHQRHGLACAACQWSQAGSAAPHDHEPRCCSLARVCRHSLCVVTLFVCAETVLAARVLRHLAAACITNGGQSVDSEGLSNSPECLGMDCCDTTIASKETGVYFVSHVFFIQRARQALETNTNSMDVLVLLPSVVVGDLPGFTDAGASATGHGVGCRAGRSCAVL